MQYRTLTNREYDLMIGVLDTTHGPAEKRYLAAVEASKSANAALHEAKKAVAHGATPEDANLEELEVKAAQAHNQVDPTECDHDAEQKQIAFLAGQVDGFRTGVAYMAQVFEENPAKAVSIIRALTHTDYASSLLADIGAQFC